MSDFNAKMHKIRFSLGLRPTPRWMSLQRSPRPRIAVFKGHTCNAREEKEGMETKSERKRKAEGESPVPQIFWPRTSPGETCLV